MPVRSAARPPRHFHAALLASASALTLFATTVPARAGNILVPGGAAPVVSASAAAIAAAQQAAQAAAQAQSSLARVTQAIQAMRTVQSATRALALSLPSAVPNGLASGGLEPDSGLAGNGAANPVTTWVGANTPTQTTSNGQTTINIQQTQPQALLNWKTFNVGTQTTVDFNQQGNTTWVALNQISATGAPSQILGSIKAHGKVYLINPNGIIFGGSSQVNVNALVASSASISTSQFLNNGIYSTETNGAYTPSFTNAGGAITVLPGAVIETVAPSTVDAGGGYVMLLGTQVTNSGIILTPQGQTVLAAGDNFLIRPGYSTSSNQYSTTAGSEVAVQLNTLGSSTTGGSGIVANNGYIEADIGDITLVGETLTQNGILLSTTDVSQRGTIHLLNSATDSFGSIALTGNSVTDILPDLGSGNTAVAAQRAGLIGQSGQNPLATSQFDDLGTLADLQDESRVEIVSGGSVEFQGNSLTQAPGGQVAVSAVGRIQVDSGATIDVSGSNITLSMTANLMQVNIQGEEQSDDPQNRTTGDLLNDDVWVDERNLIYVPAGTGGYSTARYYTAGGLLNVTNEYSDVASSIGRWTASGGTITLVTGSGGSVVAQSGSVFDIAGGSITYQGGIVPQSWLMGSDGLIYNANTAPSDITYVGVFNGFTVDHARWGVSETYANVLGPGSQSSVYEPGYTVGRDAGTLAIATPTAAFEGTIEAGAIDGTQQTSARPASVTDPFLESQTTVPLPGILSIDNGTAANLLPRTYAPVVTIGGGDPLADSLSVTTAIPTGCVNTVSLDAGQLNSDGLGGLTINASAAVTGSITINAPLILTAGGQVNFNAPTITINAGITAPGGSVTITANGGQGSVVSSSVTVANIAVAPNVTIDTTGLWTNATLDPLNLWGLAFLNGGAVTLTSTGNLILGAGSLIDASSGGAILQNGKTEGGSGGAITLAANDRANDSSVTTNPFGAEGLVLGGTLRSEGVTQGGALTLSTYGLVTIGDQPLLPDGSLTAGTPAPTVLTLGTNVVLPAGSTMPFSDTASGTVVGAGQSFLVAAKPAVTTNNTVTTAAQWTVPMAYGTVTANVDGVSQNFTSATPGGVPAGAVITGISGTLPVGTVVPGNVFPNGLPVPGFTVNFAKGAVLATNLTLAAGTLIPQGAVLQQNVTAQELDLAPSFFSRGFPAYNITGQNVIVAPNTTINVTEPVLQFTEASFAAATGGNPESALSLWLPPTYLANAVTGQLTQRAGARLSLSAQLGQVDAQNALSSGISGTQVAPLSIGQGAVLSVDPGRSIGLSARGELDVDGELRAPGGSISVLNSRPFELETTPVGGPADPALSVWIGATADLDVSAQAVTSLDLDGRPYGVVPNAGSITIAATSGAPGSGGILPSTEAFVVIRPGAVLDANGANAMIDFAAGTGASNLLRTVSSGSTLVASNGGSIALSSYTGLYIEGDLEANAGGAGAAGGTLSLTLESPIYTTNGGHNGFILSNGARALRVLTVGQIAQSSGLSSSLAPAQADPALTVGTGTISVAQIEGGGFANLSLYGGDAIEFNGNVNLSLAQSLSLNQGAISLSPSTPNAQVTLSAPYVLLNGNFGHQPQTSSGDIQYFAKAQPTTVGTGTLTINTDQIDVENQVGFGGNWTLTETSGSSPASLTENLPGFATINLTSQGDITFLANTNPALATTLETTGNLDLTAARIYPATGVTAIVVAGLPTTSGSPLSPTGVLTIANVGGAPDTTPADSVFGTLVLDAATINQGGVVEAPLGALMLGLNDSNITSSTGGALQSYAGTLNVNFLRGSITSVSANGLIIPYGGTSDGINYLYNGTAVTYVDPFNEAGHTTINNPQYEPGVVTQGLQLSSQSINVQSGALLNLSGGGDLTGAGFISGEGGSVDVLRTPLVNANPTNVGSASDKVYAIVPGYVSGYAPIAPDAGAGNPGVGQQVTIGAGVPGLPAGTYTLLPSTYGLLPGAFRVEIAGTKTALAQTGVAPLLNGSYEVAGNLGVANTGIRNAIPNEIILTPANTVTTYSQYNQTRYSQFAELQATIFGTALPSLPIDAKLLMLDYVGSGTATAPALTMDGTLNQTPGQADGLTGSTGTLTITQGTNLGNGAVGDGGIDILGPGQAPISGSLSLYASDLDAFHAGALVIGGVYWEALLPGQAISVNSRTPNNIAVYEATGGNVTVEPGAVLTAPQIFLLSNGTVTVDAGATVSTIGQGAAPWDSNTNGVVAEIEGIALSNGAITVVPYTVNTAVGITLSNAPPTTTINVQSGATLLAGGTLGFGATNGLTFGSSITLGAKDLVVAVPSVNIGTGDSLAAAQAAGVLPSGWSLDQTTLDDLLVGNSGAGVPQLQSLILTVSNSINFFGTVNLSTVDPTTGKSDLSLALTAPAIYGYGASTDVATLTTSTLIWNGGFTGSSLGVASAIPPAPITNGPGTGSGVLDLVAQQIVFGYGPNTQPQDQVALNRQTLGFETVNLEASGSITANSKGTLAVYQSETYGTNGPVGAGGSLNLVTPLLTGEAGSVMSYTAGGALSLTAPSGAAAVSTASVADLGAEVDLTAASVAIDTAVALPTGKLSVNATGDIQLGAGADIDLSGRATVMFNQTEYSWGGDVILNSAQGNITQAAGSVIDISAVDNAAGSITAEAAASGAGQVALNGTLNGALTLSAGATGSYLAGSISVDAQTLASGSAVNLTSNFAALSTALDAGGFDGARSFDLKQGDLIIASGQTIKARTISISVDGGSLTVAGTVDASGTVPGSISLAARNNLMLAGSGLLDADGTVLQADSYGKPIDAENRATVSLTAKTGTLTLASGSTIDVGSMDPDPQGDVELNVARTGEISGNANITATGTVNITGAGTIALNTFWTYAPTGASGTIVQDTTAAGVPAGAVGLKQIDTASQGFMTAAAANATLQGDLAGLAAYGAAFHLRPGVEIDSSVQSGGNLTVSGDLDFSGYRYSDASSYGLRVDNAVFGSGEPGVLAVRASNNLNVDGSINDGFAPPPATPDDNSWQLPTGMLLTATTTLLPITLAGGASGTVTTFPNTAGLTLGYAIPIRAATINANAVIPAQVTLSSAITIPAGTVLTAPILSNTGTVLFGAGTLIASATTIPSGSQLAAGTQLPTTVPITAMTWPAGANLGVFNSAVSLNANIVVPANGVVPANTSVASTTTLVGKLTAPLTLTGTMVLKGGPNGTVTSFPTTATLSFPIPITTATIKRGVSIPFAFTSNGAVNIPTTWTATGPISNAAGVVLYAAGATVPASTNLPSGTIFGANSLIPIQGVTTTLAIAAGSVVPANTVLGNIFSGTTALSLLLPLTLPAGIVLPTGTSVVNVVDSPTRPTTAGGTQGQMWAIAPMLPAGDLSWSMDLVAGADTSAASASTLQAENAPVGVGNLTLDDTHFFLLGESTSTVAPSVVRTGTGSLQLLAGGNFNQASLYGIYTAGAQSAGVTAAYQAPRSTLADGTVLGAAYAAYNAVESASQTYYPTDGGDLTLNAQGNVTSLFSAQSIFDPSDSIGAWLWEQGGTGIGQSTSWSINFGTYGLPHGPGGAIGSSNGQLAFATPVIFAFDGIGTLGGGNLTVTAGGDAGMSSGSSTPTTALTLAVGSTGRILPDGTLEETGGGTLTLDVGGGLNPVLNSATTSQSAGVITDLRGPALISAGSIGWVTLQYGLANADNPLPSNPFAPSTTLEVGGGPILAPGDSMMTVETRDDLALGGAVDPGRQVAGNATLATVNGQTGQGLTWFTLWTPTSGIALTSAGGNISPGTDGTATQGVDAQTDYPTSSAVGISLYPPTFDVAAVEGSIYGGSAELAPSPVGQLEMLAGNSIYGGDWAMSGAALTTEATPFDPAYLLITKNFVNSTNGITPSSIIATNYFLPGTPGIIDRSLFAFGADTATTDLHAGDSQPALFYAVNGDIQAVIVGLAGPETFPVLVNGQKQNTISTVYVGAKPMDIRAGGNIINLGEPYRWPITLNAPVVESFILNNDPNDVSVIQAGGSIYYANVAIGGPGTLEVMAGGNIYQGDHGLIEGIGPLVNINPYNHSSGASIIVMPGVGSAGPNWSGFANLYFNPANQGDPEQNPGDVAQTYPDQLYQWLQQNYGYAGTEAGALAYFLSLPVPQQSVFDLKVYFSELNASGLEFNDAASIRDKSYIRGKEAIATLFPTLGANGQPITYSGSLTMESGNESFFSTQGSAGLYDSGIHTEFGGNVQIVDPGGAVTVGANSITPGASTGILTEGSGDVDIYSLGSVELGLSRIFTTFGGDIVIWSATGDINAGKGAKGTVVFTPARRTYDDWGNVALSPTVPTTGAGIATLAPIPEVPPGNINLVAPLGIVDAGEAGIRVSGNVNIAALHVVNAANIQVQGSATGIPQAAAPNIGALTTASDTAGAAAAMANEVAARSRSTPAAQDLPSIITVEVIGYGGGDGTPSYNGNGAPQGDPRRKIEKQSQRQDPNSAYQILGAGNLSKDETNALIAERRKLSSQ